MSGKAQTGGKEPDGAMTTAEMAAEEDGEAGGEAREISNEIGKLDERAASDPNDPAIVRLRRRALIRRFWHSASHYWGKNGGRLARVLTGATLLVVLFNLAASYGMNLWNRAIFDALEKHDAGSVLFISLIYFPLLAASVCFGVLQVYRPHDDAAALARLAEQSPARPLAEERPLLPAQPRQRRPPESRIPHRRRRPGGDRSAGRFRDRHH